MRELPWAKLVALSALVAVLGAVALVVRGAQVLPDQVTPIVWHRQACAHCQMLIGEPGHAAQLVTGDGEVLSFDDPGCALRYLHERAPVVHRLWFHHATEERWLSAQEVAFVPGGLTPMGFGLLAVERATPGALELSAATARARAATTLSPGKMESSP